MERTLLLVFDSERIAYEAARSLDRLDSRGEIAIQSGVIVTVDANGKVRLGENTGTGSWGVDVEPSVGDLVEKLGDAAAGSVGIAAAAARGGRGSAAGEEEEALTFDRSIALAPGSSVVVVSVEENLTAPVDVRMKALGATVYAG